MQRVTGIVVRAGVIALTLGLAACGGGGGGKDEVGNSPAKPAPVGTAKTPVESAKALFSSLRTNLQAIDQGDAFRSTADAVKADLENTVLPLSNDVAGFAALVANAQEQFERYRAGEISDTLFGIYGNSRVGYYDHYAAEESGNGWCGITTNPVGISCQVFYSYLSGSATSEFTGAPVYGLYANRRIILEPIAGRMGEYAYTVILGKTGTTTSKDDVVYNWWHVLGESRRGTLKVLRKDDTITQLALYGDMPGRIDGAGNFLSDREAWSLNATRTLQTDGTTLFKFGGNFTAFGPGDTPQVLGKIAIDDSSYVRLAVQGDDANIAVNAANALEVKLGGTMGNTTINGTLRASGDRLDKSKTRRMPTSLSFDGLLNHQDGAVFNGKVVITRQGYESFDATLPESDANFVADTVELGGALSLPNRPTLSLTLGATRTGKDTADISAQYRDGTSVINASVTAKTGERHPLVKVASADGVAFSFTDTSVPVPVTKDGEVVAQIDLAKGIITYRDGSTESFK